MRDGFIFTTELTSGVARPISFQQIVFCSDCVVPEPQPDLTLQEDFAFPRMFERSVNVIIAQMIVNRFHNKLTIFRPLPGWTVIAIR